MKRVLILLSAYNGQQYLAEQLDSLVCQKGVDVHILLRDDGSTNPDSLFLVRSYISRGYPLTLIEGKNEGFSMSFSILMEEAYAHFQGYDYYAFCDQDDVWLEDKLLAAVSQLDAVCAFSNIKPIAYCSYTTLVDKNLHVIRGGRNDGAVKMTKQNCLLQSYATGCTMVFNRMALQLYVSHMPSELYAHDMMLYQMCMYLGKVIYDRNSYILYRQHGNNQIGTSNFWGRMKKRMAYKKHRGTLELQSRRFLALYKDVLSLDDIAIISKLAFYKNNVFGRFALLFDKTMRYSTFEANFFFFLKIIRGGYSPEYQNVTLFVDSLIL